MSKAIFKPIPFKGLPCDTFNCTDRATYFVTSEFAPPSVAHRLCDTCVKSLVSSSPFQELGTHQHVNLSGEPELPVHVIEDETSTHLEVQVDEDTVTVDLNDDGNQEYVCVTCVKTFKNERGYKSHLKQVHGDEA